MRNFSNLIIFICLALVFCTGCNEGASDNNSKNLLPVLGDIHFSPFFDPDLFPSLMSSSTAVWPEIFKSSKIKEPQAWGHVTNYFLFQDLLKSLEDNINNCPMLILQGDLLSHGFKEQFYELYGDQDEVALRNFVKKTMKFIAVNLREAVARDIPIVFVLGNNDSYAGDYSIIPNGEFLEDTSLLFYNTYLLEEPDFSAYSDTYQEGGYYKFEPSSVPDLTLICLNTVMFSKNWTDIKDGNAQNAPERQLDWLEKTLVSARKNQNKVWLLTHIPTGVSAYGTIKDYMDDKGHILDASMLWKSKYQDRFLEIINNYSENIEAIFAGHTHMDEYRIIKSAEDMENEIIFVTPAISPLFGNSPAFKIFRFSDTNFKLVDYQSFTYPFANSSDTFSFFYEFSDTYNLNSNLNLSLEKLYKELPVNNELKAQYITNYYSGHNETNNITPVNWQIYWCTIGYMNKEDFISCVNN